MPTNYDLNTLCLSSNSFSTRSICSSLHSVMIMTVLFLASHLTLRGSGVVFFVLFLIAAPL
nr:MAG TPA: hypothetical protein [Caudoviricetes sp.]